MANYNFSMLRLRLVILLLVLLPLQQSWAAMGPYCEDAQIRAALSLATLCGDHASPTAGPEALPDLSDATANGHAADDLDCGTCHANGTAVFFGVHTVDQAQGTAMVLQGLVTLPGAVPAPRPERPQWRALG